MDLKNVFKNLYDGKIEHLAEQDIHDIRNIFLYFSNNEDSISCALVKKICSLLGIHLTIEKFTFQEEISFSGLIHLIDQELEMSRKNNESKFQHEWNMLNHFQTGKVSIHSIQHFLHPQVIETPPPYITRLMEIYATNSSPTVFLENSDYYLDETTFKTFLDMNKLVIEGENQLDQNKYNILSDSIAAKSSLQEENTNITE